MAIDAFTLESTGDGLRFLWAPSPLLLTPTSTLQGGAGLGAAVAAMQTATGRPVIWATAQYLSFAAGAEPIDIAVTIEVTGHNTTQARCVLSRDGDEILTAHAASGPRLRVRGCLVHAPGSAGRRTRVPPTRSSSREMGTSATWPSSAWRTDGRSTRSSVTVADGDGSFALWVRCWDGQRLTTVPDLTFVGDFMPLGFADATGHSFAGNSLDNTIRVGKLVETEWILLSVQVQQIANGFGYGRAELWSEDRTLLGEVSQSSILRTRSRIRERAPS